MGALFSVVTGLPFYHIEEHFLRQDGTLPYSQQNTIRLIGSSGANDGSTRWKAVPPAIMLINNNVGNFNFKRNAKCFFFLYFLPLPIQQQFHLMIFL